MIGPLYINCVAGDKLPSNGDFLMRAAHRLDIDVRDVAELGEEQPDYVLNCEYYEDFVKGKIWTGAWEVDTYLDRWQYRPWIWDNCDEIFVIAKEALLPRMKHFEERTKFLPLAIDPEMHVYDSEIRKEFDLLVGGSMHGEGVGPYQKRVDAYNLLKRYYSFDDIGTGNTYRDWWAKIHTARVQFIRPGSTDVKDSILAQRFYEQMVVGPVLIYRCSDLKRLNFVEDVDYLAYDNDMEMIDKMQLLLENPEYANQIASNGREKVLADHTYDHRLREILTYIP